MTYAEVAEMLAKKKGKYEGNLDSFDRPARNSARRMIDRIDGALDELFQAQEASKPQPVMAMGGKLPKYGGGIQMGDPDPEPPAYDRLRNVLYGLVNPMIPLYRATNKRIGQPAAKAISNGKTSGGSTWDFLNNWIPTTNAPRPYLAMPQYVQPQVKEAAVMATPVATPRRRSGVKKPAATVTPVPTPIQAKLPELMPLATNGLPSSIKSMTARPPQIQVMHGKQPFNWQGAGDKALRALSYVLPFAEVGAGRRAISRMEGPATPLLVDPLRMNTTFDINPQLIDARRAQAELNRAASDGNTSGGAANNVRVMGMAQRLNQIGQLYSQKQNVEAGLRNQVAQANSGIQAGNVGILNDYNQRGVDFRNQREAALYENNKALFDRLQGVTRDFRLERADIERLKIIMKQYDPGVVRRSLGDTAYANLVQSLEASGDPTALQIAAQFKKIMR